MKMDNNNYWDEFEYDKLKLLCHREKVQSILEVGEKIKIYDNLPPISVEMHLTDNCNLACPWCTDRALLGNGAMLSKDVAFSLLREFGQMGTGVTLEGGGEPTIHPDFREIVNYGYENEVPLGLITNGTVDISDSLNQFRWVRISLDASTKEEYILEKGKDLMGRVLDNLAKYKDIRDVRKCYLGIGYVVTRRNYSQIDDIIDKLDDLGVDYLYLRPVEEAEDITPTREELYDLRKRILSLTENRRIKFKLVINDRLIQSNAGLPCVAHSITSIIHANGDVVCCEKRRHDNLILGNVNNSSFKEIWRSEARIKATGKMLDAAQQRGCSACRITGFNMLINNLNNLNTREFI